MDKNKVLQALLWLCANNLAYKLVKIDYDLLDSWPENHIPQEIRDAFLALRTDAGNTNIIATDEREGYTTSLQDGLFENDLDAELVDSEPGSIVSRSFFSDFHGQDLQSTPAVLASLQAILREAEDNPPEVPLQDEDNGKSLFYKRRSVLIKVLFQNPM